MTNKVMILNLEGDDEGFVEPPKGRAGNYTIDEDILLCTTLNNVGMDAAVGTDQKGDTYWTRMKEYFDTYNTSGIDQTYRHHRSRWGTNMIVFLFCSFILHKICTGEIQRRTRRVLRWCTRNSSCYTIVRRS
jgi:hypothetical protein